MKIQIKIFTGDNDKLWGMKKRPYVFLIEGRALEKGGQLCHVAMTSCVLLLLCPGRLRS